MKGLHVAAYCVQVHGQWVCLFMTLGLGLLASSTFRIFSLLSTPYCEDDMYLWKVAGLSN